MEQVNLESVRTTLIAFTERVEKATKKNLVATIVASAQLFALLYTENNQVIYDRGGTAKTHALKVPAEHAEQQNGVPVPPNSHTTPYRQSARERAKSRKARTLADGSFRVGRYRNNGNLSSAQSGSNWTRRPASRCGRA
jgi:hypothetical protein